MHIRHIICLQPVQMLYFHEVGHVGKEVAKARHLLVVAERFVKVDEFVPGTGLGLSICRSLALSIGGKVGVESKLNVGSLFWVEIPIE